MILVIKWLCMYYSEYSTFSGFQDHGYKETCKFRACEPCLPLNHYEHIFLDQFVNNQFFLVFIKDSRY